MIEFLNAHFGELVSAILGLLAGVSISVPITVRVMRNSLRGSATQSNQSGASAGGDIVGRDKISH